MNNLDQLKMFCEWERAHNARPGKTHIAEWALREIERLQADLERGQIANVKNLVSMSDTIDKLRAELATSQAKAPSNQLAEDMREFIYRVQGFTPFEHAAWVNDRGQALLQAVKQIENADAAPEHSATVPAEVPMPDIRKLLRECNAPDSAFYTVWKDGIDLDFPAPWIEQALQKYGDAGEAAGLAEAGRRVALWLKDPDVQRMLEFARDASRKVTSWPDRLKGAAQKGGE